MEQNPYTSPIADPDADLVGPDSPGGVYQLATQGKRFINMFVDHIILQASSFVIGVVLAAASVALQGPEATSAVEDESFNWLAFLIALLVSYAYFVITESLFQRTLAKFLTGTMVVTEDGGKPSFAQILGRSLARFVPFEPLSFLGSKNPVGWHDSWSGTLVVLKK